MLSPARARSSLASDDEVTIAVAPMALANWSANTATPPVPRMSTLSPALICPSTTSARHAVSAAHGSVAASRWLHPFGACVNHVAGVTTVSSAYPSSPSPGTWLKLPCGASPFCQYGKKHDTTASPTANSVTSAPTAPTTPAPSDIRMRPLDVGMAPTATA